PGLGQKVGEDYKGLDVDVARYVAKELGFEGDKVIFKETPSAQRETAIQGGQVALIFATYSITDERKKKVSFAGPYFIAGQDLLVRADNTDITGPDAMNGKTLCSVTGSTPAEKIKKDYATTVKLFEQDTYSKCVEALVGGTVDAVTTDNVILAGFAAQPQYAGKLKVVGKPFSTERYGVGLKMGDTELCNKVNAALEKMVSDGSWQKAIDANVGPSGFKVDTSTNPPKPDACAAA
ncbi:MAG TPA: glutamate ABC transporter substrate-binding protein, partial [Propionibacteriaceae bacterium]|nr:glutamate ABC transporter substrate-binding protein [Propionibacteriaceae bacterium]